ncbi:RNA polymerase sigma factor RpoE [Minicystis rosea]|nr:RNA polymerase sigma factor RpoE [Minicystis rosea]
MDPPSSARATPIGGGALFRAHAAFVACFLVRLGVKRPELDDAVQEVFLIAHRRGGFVEGDAQPTTWLAEIALRVASDMRRSRRRRASAFAAVPPPENGGATPFEVVAATESLARVQQALDTLSLEHRAVFILYEIEGASCESIAAGMRIPIGTVYSRLHAARRGFQAAYARLDDSSPGLIHPGAKKETA